MPIKQKQKTPLSPSKEAKSGAEVIARHRSN
jgi:hypothetical protein